MRLVKSRLTKNHMFLFNECEAVILEGSFKCKIVDITEDILVDVTCGTFTFNPRDHHLFSGSINFYFSNEVLDISDICLTDIISQYNEKKTPSLIEWTETKEVKCPNTHQWMPIDVFKENENTVWFRDTNAPPAVVAPSDINYVSLMFINKSSPSYRNIKKANVTLNESCTEIVADGPVNAVITIEGYCCDNI